MTHVPPSPPIARKIFRSIEQLGRTRHDSYAWIRDENWQAVLKDPGTLSSDIKAHLDAENSYSKAILSETQNLQQTIIQEIHDRIEPEETSVPLNDGPWAYYRHYQKDGEHPIFLRQFRDGNSPPEVLLDADALAKNHSFFAIGSVQHSPDHKYLIYAIDTQGSEYFRIFIKILGSGEVLATDIIASTGDFVISPDSCQLFWVFRDDMGRPKDVFQRPLLGHKADDKLIYQEKDEGMFLSIDLTLSQRYLTITANNHETSEIWLLDMEDGDQTLFLVQERQKTLYYDLVHWPSPEYPDRLVIRTNADGALDFKLCLTQAKNPGKAFWKDFIGHKPGHYIVEQSAYQDFLVRKQRNNANNEIIITDSGDFSEYTIRFDEDAYVSDFEEGYEFATRTLRLTYQSPRTPKSWFDYNMATRTRSLRKTQQVPSGHDPDAYVVKRVISIAKDGAEIPITLLFSKDTALDGSAPVLLYGYGAYGLAMEPYFSVARFSLVNRGVIFAIAHIRGGSEKGWTWFLDGRGRKKPNSFTDFIACAETLIAENYTKPQQIVAMGGSAGGMLMGAVTNMRPDLWAGVIAEVPFVDVLNTMSDSDLPLTPPEWPEWGNPLKNRKDYDLIASYSPYENITHKAYPPILATGGLSDPRVTYWEPAKWVVKLREHQISQNPILLSMNMEAGHAGTSGRYKGLKDIARNYGFALWSLSAFCGEVKTISS